MIFVILVLTYLFLVNAFAFTFYGIDKYWSQIEHRRVSEGALLGLAIAGGAYGAGMAMLLFRHKTLHDRFRIIVPIAFVVWLILCIVLCLL